ncbi:hypothetical protein [Escherichia coli]|uniref:hypothetical protein n=1 Tax=Escherichia coli TaxID=562 RepID=UPI001926E771|nr:hypothetical protein [Escherichia coli]
MKVRNQQNKCNELHSLINKNNPLNKNKIKNPNAKHNVFFHYTNENNYHAIIRDYCFEGSDKDEAGVTVPGLRRLYLTNVNPREVLLNINIATQKVFGRNRWHAARNKMTYFFEIDINQIDLEHYPFVNGDSPYISYIDNAVFLVIRNAIVSSGRVAQHRFLPEGYRR